MLLSEKKCTTWKVWVKFYLGQNEDYSLEDSISDSSEKHAIMQIFFAEGWG